MSNYEKIALMGECMIELQDNGVDSVARKFAGDTLNTSVYLSRLTQSDSQTIAYVTALGIDRFSDQMCDFFISEGISTDLVQRSETHLPGIYYVDLDDNGERRFYYWRSQSAARYLLSSPGWENVLDQLLEYDLLYFSGISLAILEDSGRDRLIEFLPRFKAAGGKLVFDNNYRPRLWADRAKAQHFYRLCLEQTDLALLTADDDLDLWQDADLESLINRNAQYQIGELVIKRGADPCLIIKDNSRYEVAAERVDNVVDTNAAGDSFSAGYLSGWVKGNSPEDCARQGHYVASQVIQHKGAIIPRDINIKVN
jgi:2-dehydro-3-deoxygluconokinase